MDRPQIVDETALRPLIEAFYARVRADPGLGPVFADAVSDWDDHHGRLADFWSSVMLGSGRYKGNPVALHLIHADRLAPELFTRWLELWRLTTAELLPPAAAAAMQEKAGRIAESLQLAIRYRRPIPA